MVEWLCWLDWIAASAALMDVVACDAALRAFGMAAEIFVGVEAAVPPDAVVELEPVGLPP